MFRLGKRTHTPQEDLTGVVIEARRGLRRDVKLLCDALKEGWLFAGLAKRLSEGSDDRRVHLHAGQQIALHHLSHPETHEIACAAFTRLEFLTPLQEQLNWRTDGGPLEYCRLPARPLFEMILPDLNSGAVSHLVINPFQETVLELAKEEVAALVKNEPIPLKRYLQQLPIQENEQIIVGKPAVPPPAILVQVIENYVRTHPDLDGYNLFQMFNTERDTESHLGLNLRAKSSSKREDIVREITLAMEGKIPPPGYIDIVFNSDIAKGIR